MGEFSELLLNELGAIVTGRTPPTARPELLGSGAAFITPTDIDEASIFATPQRRLSPEGQVEFRRCLLPPDAVCFTCIASIGKMCLTREVSLTNQQINSIIVDKSRFDPRWVFYMLKDKRAQIAAIASGSATPIINKTAFGNVRVNAPPLPTQRRIASILGAYDDLIEVNRRRVAVLEGMARGLFEEWFVRFRFPGSGQGALQDAADIEFPNGLRTGTLGEIAALKSGYAFKSAAFVDDGAYSLVTIKHVHDGRLVPPFDTKISVVPTNMPAHCHIRSGDTLLSLTGNVGRVCLAWGENLLLNQRVAKVVAVRPWGRAFSYFWFRRPQTLKLLQQISNGVAQQNLSPIRAMELPVIIPETELMQSFENVAGPIMDGAILLHRAIAKLQEQRDLMLPRLISGQLSVEAAERELEDVG